MAELRLSPDAAADRPVRRLAGDGDAAGGGAALRPRRPGARSGARCRSSLRLTLFLSIPAAVGPGGAGPPIIALIYQHGHFSAHDTDETALALQAYALGLAGYAAIRVLTPCFYALNLPRTPLRIEPDRDRRRTWP